MRLSRTILASIFLLAGLSQAAYTPNHKDSGWVRIFNGKDLTGLHPWIVGSSMGQNPGNIVTVHDSMIHFYQGRKRADNPALPMTDG